jgi:hypothetical protein
MVVLLYLLFTLFILLPAKINKNRQKAAKGNVAISKNNVAKMK